MTNHLNKILIVSTLLLWVWVSSRYLFWFISHLDLHFDLLHAILFVAVTVFWITRSNLRLTSTITFHNNIPALLLGMFSLLLLIFFKTQSSIRLFGFVASLYLIYSLAGLVISPQRWRSGLIPFSLLIMTLPFGRHLDVFIGYPLRMLSVNAAYQALHPIIPELDTVSSLLIIENRASQVDMDCSGLKGVWVGLLLYFLVSWLENVRTNWKWLCGIFLFLVYLVAGNLLRITLLSMVHLRWQNEALDPWVHHSTSIFFLVTGLVLCFWFLKFKIPKKTSVKKVQNADIPFPHVNLLLIIPLLSIPLFLPSYEDVPHVKPSGTIAQKIIEQGWQAEELRAVEKKVYDREGVSGYKFRKGENQMILVLNGDWRSQHKPELCYELSGLPLSGMNTLLMRQDFPVKQLKFKNRQEKAFFWFQSGNLITEDFATKVWNQVSGDNREWTMVSFLNHNGDIPQEEILNIYHLIAHSE